MNNLVINDSEWLTVKSSIGTGLVKVFKFPTLPKILDFSKQAMQLIEQNNATDTSIIFINGFECIISLHIDAGDEISEQDRSLAAKIIGLATS